MTSRMVLSVIAAAMFLAGFSAASLRGWRDRRRRPACRRHPVRPRRPPAGRGRPDVGLDVIAPALFALSDPLGARYRRMARRSSSRAALVAPRRAPSPYLAANRLAGRPIGRKGMPWASAGRGGQTARVFQETGIASSNGGVASATWFAGSPSCVAARALARPATAAARDDMIMLLRRDQIALSLLPGAGPEAGAACADDHDRPGWSQHRSPADLGLTPSATRGPRSFLRRRLQRRRLGTPGGSASSAGRVEV